MFHACLIFGIVVLINYVILLFVLYTAYKQDKALFLEKLKKATREFIVMTLVVGGITLTTVGLLIKYNL